MIFNTLFSLLIEHQNNELRRDPICNATRKHGTHYLHTHRFRHYLDTITQINTSSRDSRIWGNSWGSKIAHCIATHKNKLHCEPADNCNELSEDLTPSLVVISREDAPTTRSTGVAYVGRVEIEEIETDSTEIENQRSKNNALKQAGIAPGRPHGRLVEKASRPVCTTCTGV